MVKWVFLFSRYFGIASQIAGCILTAGPLAHVPIEPRFCKVWFTFQVSASRCLFSALEIILSLRVYALYDKSYRMGLLLGCWLSVGFIIVLGFGVASALNTPSDSICNAQGPSRDAAYVSVAMIVTHTFLWSLTVTKRSIPLNDGWRRNPIVRLVIRDGAWIFFAIFAISVAMMPFSLVNHVMTHVIFSWPMGLVSILTCRLVLNMQDLKPQNPTIETEFSTMVDFSVDNI